MGLGPRRFRNGLKGLKARNGLLELALGPQVQAEQEVCPPEVVHAPEIFGVLGHPLFGQAFRVDAARDRLVQLPLGCQEGPISNRWPTVPLPPTQLTLVAAPRFIQGRLRLGHRDASLAEVTGKLSERGKAHMECKEGSAKQLGAVLILGQCVLDDGLRSLVRVTRVAELRLPEEHICESGMGDGKPDTVVVTL